MKIFVVASFFCLVGSAWAVSEAYKACSTAVAEEFLKAFDDYFKKRCTALGKNKLVKESVPWNTILPKGCTAFWDKYYPLINASLTRIVQDGTIDDFSRLMVLFECLREEGHRVFSLDLSGPLRSFLDSFAYTTLNNIIKMENNVYPKFVNCSFVAVGDSCPGETTTSPPGTTTPVTTTPPPITTTTDGPPTTTSTDDPTATTSTDDPTATTSTDDPTATTPTDDTPTTSPTDDPTATTTSDDPSSSATPPESTTETPTDTTTSDGDGTSTTELTNGPIIDNNTTQQFITETTTTDDEDTTTSASGCDDGPGGP